MSKQYDNSNSGALFATGDKAIMNGPFTAAGKTTPTHNVVLKVGEPGAIHELTFYERDKEGKSKGKPVGKGTFQVTPSKGAPNQNGQPTPYARAIVTGKLFKGEEVRLCGWMQDHDTLGSFVQLKPDALPPRAMPEL